MKIRSLLRLLSVIRWVFLLTVMEVIYEYFLGNGVLAHDCRTHIWIKRLHLSVNQSKNRWVDVFNCFLNAPPEAAKIEVKWRIISHRGFQGSIRWRWNFRFSEINSLSNDISKKIEHRCLSILHSETEFKMPNYGSFRFELTWNSSKLKFFSPACRLKAHWHTKSKKFLIWSNSLDAVIIWVELSSDISSRLRFRFRGGGFGIPRGLWTGWRWEISAWCMWWHNALPKSEER